MQGETRGASYRRHRQAGGGQRVRPTSVRWRRLRFLDDLIRFFGVNDAVWRNAFIDVRHGTNSGVVSNQKIVADNATVGAHIHIVANLHPDGPLRMLCADGGVLPQDEVFADDRFAGDGGANGVQDAQALANRRAQTKVGSVAGQESSVDA